MIGRWERWHSAAYSDTIEANVSPGASGTFPCGWSPVHGQGTPRLRSRPAAPAAWYRRRVVRARPRPADDRIGVDAARRIALAAQGFADPRPSGRVAVGHLRRVIDRVAVLQLDPVNVLCRSHYLPLFARLGPYPRDLLDRMCWGERGRELFEYWGHQASLLPMRWFPLLRWRMAAAARQQWGGDLRGWRTWLDPALRLAPWAVISGMGRLATEQPGLLDEVLAVVAKRGPVAAVDASPDGRRHGDGSDLGTGVMWNWHDAKIALEWLFYLGRVTTATRRNFHRLYDLTDRVIPADVRGAPAPGQPDAQRELVRIAARALGVATVKQLRSYFFIPAEDATARVTELVDAGELVPVRVDGLAQQMYLWPQASAPTRVRARALLSPFDSLIWDRDRTLRLFDFPYRISIYTPVAERVHGFYVLPFLLGERLVARVDLRAERDRSVLAVPAVHAEPGVSRREVAAELADELRLMAGWLELDRLEVGERGDLAAELSRAVG
jgi:hypothetical protein